MAARPETRASTNPTQVMALPTAQEIASIESTHVRMPPLYAQVRARARGDVNRLTRFRDTGAVRVVNATPVPRPQPRKRRRGRYIAGAAVSGFTSLGGAGYALGTAHWGLTVLGYIASAAIGAALLIWLALSAGHNCPGHHCAGCPG